MKVTLKTCLVLNPLSGGRRSDRLRAQLARSFLEVVPGGEVRETRGPGDAERLVRDLVREGFECVAVAGGDGTINEAVNGYFEGPLAPDGEPPRPVNPRACLAVVPVGTGGDFRRSLGLEPDPIASLSLLTGTSTVACDLGMATFTDRQGARASRIFANITSFGLSSLVVEYVNSSGRRVPGSLAYFASTLRAFFNYRPVKVRVLMDHQEQRVDTALLVAVANGRFFGGGMEIAPLADLHDGALEVMIVGNSGLVDFLVHSGKLYGGRIMDHPRVTHGRAAEVLLDTVEEGDTMLLEMDGESLGRLPATLRVLPAALRLKS